jgi:hypothetical protein
VATGFLGTENPSIKVVPEKHCCTIFHFHQVLTFVKCSGVGASQESVPPAKEKNPTIFCIDEIDACR